MVFVNTFFFFFSFLYVFFVVVIEILGSWVCVCVKWPLTINNMAMLGAKTIFNILCIFVKQQYIIYNIYIYREWTVKMWRQQAFRCPCGAGHPDGNFKKYFVLQLYEKKQNCDGFLLQQTTNKPFSLNISSTSLVFSKQ